MSLLIPDQNTSVDLKEQLKTATAFQVRLATAMLYHPTPESAARSLKVSLDVLKDNAIMNKVWEILEVIKSNYVESSFSLMEHYLPKAIAVKMQGLDSLNEKIRQDTAEYVIDRFLGRPASNANVNIRQNSSQTIYHIGGVDPKTAWTGPLDPEDIIDGEDLISHGEHNPD